MHNKKQGFTLIELIVVIAILAILAVALIPLINSFIEKSRVSQLMTTASTLETAAVAFNADIGVFPIQDDGGKNFKDSALSTDPGLANWDGPYLNRNTEGVSPWGSQMSLDFLELTGDTNEEEYALIVASGTGAGPGDSGVAIVPTASYAILEQKIDGTPSDDVETGAANGKAQREGSNTEENDVQIVIVADAKSEATSPDLGGS